jgi:hypothetical protein
MKKINDIELRRAYRRLLCASEDPFKDYAVTVLADLLDECGVFDVGFQLGGTPADNGYLAGRRSIGMVILDKLGISDIKDITQALGLVPPEDIEKQEVAE